MKRISFFLLLSLVLLLPSCRRHSNIDRLTLERLDSLCEEDPQAALAKLELLESDISKESEYAMRRWQLLWTKARYRQDMPLESDSLMKLVVNYFERMGNDEERIEAYYYLASCYYDMHDSPRCVTYGRKAIDASEKAGHIRPMVAIRICSMLADVFRRQYNFQEALIYAKEEVDIANRHGLLDAECISEIADCYFRMKDTLNAVHYYKRALTMIRSDLDITAHASSLCELLMAFSGMGRLEESDECYRMVQKLPVEVRPLNYNTAKAYYFGVRRMLDSVEYYQKLELEQPSLYKRRAATQVLMGVSHLRGDYKLSSDYGLAFVHLNDTLLRQLELEQTRNANNLYQYRRDMEAETEAYRQARRAKELFYFGFALCIVLLLLITVVYFGYKWRMAKQLLLKEQQLKNAKRQNENLTHEILRAKANENGIEILHKVKMAAKGQRGPLEEPEWIELRSVLNNMNPDSLAKVYDREPILKDTELHVLYLMMIGLKPIEIIKVTGRSKTNVYEKIARLQKTFGDLLKGSSVDEVS